MNWNRSSRVYWLVWMPSIRRLRVSKCGRKHSGWFFSFCQVFFVMIKWHKYGCKFELRQTDFLFKYNIISVTLRTLRAVIMTVSIKWYTRDLQTHFNSLKIHRSAGVLKFQTVRVGWDTDRAVNLRSKLRCAR